VFSKYKKPSDAAGAGKAPSAKPKIAAVPDKAADAAPKKNLMKAMPTKAADVVGADKEKRRKERLGEIKLELHKSLLDNLNLAALESASEADLRAEINAIATESLQEMGVVLNREERTTLSQSWASTSCAPLAPSPKRWPPICKPPLRAA